MKYLAITQRTSDWLCNDSRALKTLQIWLTDSFNYDQVLNKGVAFLDNIRIMAMDNKVLCIWNTDYILGSGDEKWGFIRLDGELGLLGKKDRFSNTFDDFLFVVSKRLQGLLISHPSKRHYSLSKKVHSISNSSKIDTYSILFKDINLIDEYSNNVKSIICTGTASSSMQAKQIEQLENDEKVLGELVRLCNQAIVVSKGRPALDLMTLGKIRHNHINKVDLVMDAPKLSKESIEELDNYNTLNFTYEDWIEDESPLNEAQRAILQSDSLLHRPLRIIGAAGTGKSLLMQLLAVKRLKFAESKGQKINILYICHSNDMANSVVDRFETLGTENYIYGETDQRLVVNTLFQYCFESTDEITKDMILSPDAYQNKEFQKGLISRFLGETIEECNGNKEFKHDEYPIIQQIIESNAREIFIEALSNEIGIAIKGRIDGEIEQLYTESETPLSRLHGVLNYSERKFVFKVYTKYHKYLFSDEGFLDSDDVAITFLLNKKTPLWNLRRKTAGFDFVFVDETQLFNENERQLFSLLTKCNNGHVPIALALDEAQDLKGGFHKGFANLGILELENKHLVNVHRCTPEILKLAFFLIQRTTDLFGSEFPDFTQSTVSLVNGNDPKSKPPKLIISKDNIIDDILLQITELKSKNVRQICVVFHSSKYWDELVPYIQKESSLNTIVLDRRGEKIDQDKPYVILTRPESVGGQEFEAVISIGLEEGVVPERVSYTPLANALEQQALREMYLSITRAKLIYIIINHHKSSPSKPIQLAMDNGLIEK